VGIAHLVRDSRAVAFSWGREVEQPEYANHPTLRGKPLVRYSSPTAALHWLVQNGGFHALKARGISTEVIQYEHLVKRPEAEIRRLLTSLRLGDQLEGEPALDAAQYEAKPFHTIGGSRIRFKRGVIEIREDDEWRTAMGRKDRLVVTAITLPLLLAYRYI
jgi:hypothetical protein